MLGVFGVIAISLGMAVTISAVSVLSIPGKKRILKITEKQGRLNTFMHEGIEITGAVIIFLFGLFMMLPFLASGTAV